LTIRAAHDPNWYAEGVEISDTELAANPGRSNRSASASSSSANVFGADDDHIGGGGDGGSDEMCAGG